MAGIITAVNNICGGGNHGDVVITIDGQQFTIDRHKIGEPLTASELALFVELGARRLRQSGLSLSQLLNRVSHGEEATNVKVYNFFGPGAAITKTNIGTSYVNICPGANGERIALDFTGCTEYRVMLNANLVGTGQWGARIVMDSDNTVLHDAPNLGAAGEREADTGWLALPAAFLGQGLMFMRAQAKSQTGADDPVFRKLQVGLR